MPNTREQAPSGADYPAYVRARWPERLSLRIATATHDKIAAEAAAASAPLADVAREALLTGLDLAIRRRRARRGRVSRGTNGARRGGTRRRGR